MLTKLKLILILSFFIGNINAQSLLSFNETINFNTTQSNSIKLLPIKPLPIIIPQLNVLPQEQFYTLQYERRFGMNTLNALSVRPFVVSYENQSLSYYINTDLKQYRRKFINHLVNQNLFQYKYKIFDLAINPIFNINTTTVITDKDANPKRVYDYCRGIQIHGHITRKIFYSTSFIESQSRFINYYNSFIADTGVVPQMARVKNYKNNVADYEYSDAIICYKPNEYIDISTGYNRNFFGNGYRSLMYSDNAMPTTNLKFNAHMGKIHYTWMLAGLQNFKKGNVLASAYDKKYIAIHYLDFWVGKHLEIGLFESVVWPKYDSTNYRGFEVNYLVPVIFYHSVQNYLGSSDNSLIGLNINYAFNHSLHFYSQIVIDDLDLGRSTQQGFYRNKFAYQLGMKWLPLNVKNLFFTVEYNQAQPYTYAHKIPAIAYTHMQQALAHPLGANFREFIAIGNYDFKRFYVQAKLQLAQLGIDSNGSHNGNNIFRSDYDIAGFPKSYSNKLLQGLKTDLFNTEFKIGYLLNPVNRTSIELSITNRKETNKLLSSNTLFISFGIRSNLFNRYPDF